MYLYVLGILISTQEHNLSEQNPSVTGRCFYKKKIVSQLVRGTFFAGRFLAKKNPCRRKILR
jgi:hypothetical protein